MIVVGSTMAAFVMDQRPTWASWLVHHDKLVESHPDGVHYFAALEVDKRGIEPFQPLIDELKAIGGQYFTYSLDDYRTEVTSANRITHICMGRNIIQDYAYGMRASHILFLDADTAPDPETFPKLLEMKHDLVGGNVGTYGLSGPRVDKYPFYVEEHMNTAGYLLVAQRIYSRLRWRWEWGLTDDPCYNKDSIEFFNTPTYVRKDCVGQHYPQYIGPIETRGHDMVVVR